MNKKLKLFMSLVLAMTMMFGSTLCFAAENGAEIENGLSVESNDNGRVTARSMTGSAQKTVSIGNTGVVAYIKLTYAWEDGYTGWFTDASIEGTYVPVGTSLVLKDFSKGDIGNSSYITVTLKYRVNLVDYNISQRYYVNEWGEVSEQ